jgi:hypothetical protein
MGEAARGMSRAGPLAGVVAVGCLAIVFGSLVAAPIRAVMADDIPVAHTPLPGGYGKTFPPPVLATCTEPLVEGAPDLRGIWKAVHVVRDGKALPPDDAMYGYAERIEQCGNRIVAMGHGQIADARADGTEENAVHEVSALDYETPIVAIASYEDGAFVLRPLLIRWLPVTIPWIEVTRRLLPDGRMVWTRPDLGRQTVTLERIGGPNDTYTVP